LIGEWFIFDAACSRSDSKPWDWYARLATSASTAVQQWIMATLGYTEPGRKQPSLDDLSVEQMLMSIRTTAAKGRNPYPTWELSTVSLDQHVQWQAEESTKPKPPTQCKLAVLQQKEEINEIAKATTPLPDAILRNALERSEGVTSAIAEDVDSVFANMASNPLKMMDAFDREILINCEPPDIMKLPPAVQYPAALNPTEYAWLVGNTLAKIEITMQLARQERDGWNLLWVRSKEQLDQWDTRMKELESERAYIQRVRKMVLEINDTTAEKGDRLDRIEAEVNKTAQNPLVSRQLGRDINRQRSFHNSPVSLPVPSRERSSPLVPPYFACKIWLIKVETSKAPIVLPTLAVRARILTHPLPHTIQGVIAGFASSVPAVISRRVVSFRPIVETRKICFRLPS
jgi:hypothetical protein